MDEFPQRARSHHVGSSGNGSRTKEGLTAAIDRIGALRGQFWDEVVVPGEQNYRNQELEKAGRVADFLRTR